MADDALTPPNRDKLAAIQQRIADAHDEWADSVQREVRVPCGLREDDRSIWTELAYADEEQMADLDVRMTRALSAADDYLARIEGSFDDRVALAALRGEIRCDAALSDEDRTFLSGRVAQYVADLRAREGR